MWKTMNIIHKGILMIGLLQISTVEVTSISTSTTPTTTPTTTTNTIPTISPTTTPTTTASTTPTPTPTTTSTTTPSTTPTPTLIPTTIPTTTSITTPSTTGIIDGFQMIRLVDGASPSEGRVEVSYGGEWGTICDMYWNDIDARVVCRQLNYLDGVAQPNSFYGAGTGPSWWSYVICDGHEKAIWSCQTSGFSVNNTWCRDHTYDASVYCTNRVRLQPNIKYGAVEIWNNNSYQLVCADGFDDIAAKVVCKSGGFKYGISVCCSAFGDMTYTIGYHSVHCQGGEGSILECSYNNKIDNCPSGKYASVACSNHQQAVGEYDLRLANTNSGFISIKHFDIWGRICGYNFDDSEAMVICREMGYQGGFAYTQIRYNIPEKTDIHWLSNINCTGQESYLGTCGNFRWGSVDNCAASKEPSVYCYQKEGYKLRLANGTSNSSGRVEISIDNNWSTICTYAGFGNAAADVICRQLNYSGGQVLPHSSFGKGSGKILVTGVRCDGTENSLMECDVIIDSYLKNEGPAFSISYYVEQYHKMHCDYHAEDAAVKCFDSRLTTVST